MRLVVEVTGSRPGCAPTHLGRRVGHLVHHSRLGPISQLCSDENVPIPGVEPASLGSEPYDIGKKTGTSWYVFSCYVYS